MLMASAVCISIIRNATCDDVFMERAVLRHVECRMQFVIVHVYKAFFFVNRQSLIVQVCLSLSLCVHVCVHVSHTDHPTTAHSNSVLIKPQAVLDRAHAHSMCSFGSSRRTVFHLAVCVYAWVY